MEVKKNKGCCSVLIILIISYFQVGKEMLCPRQSVNGETPGFNLLMELLRGDH